MEADHEEDHLRLEWLSQATFIEIRTETILLKIYGKDIRAVVDVARGEDASQNKK